MPTSTSTLIYPLAALPQACLGAALRLLLSGCLALAAHAAQAEPEHRSETVATSSSARELQLRVGADELADEIFLIDVHVGNGRLRLIGSQREDISVVVQLVLANEGHGESRLLSDAVAGAALARHTRDGGVFLQINYPAQFSPGQIIERWTVLVPERLSAEIEMSAGQLRVVDVGGGVDAQLGFGDIDISVPGGPVRGAVSNGNIRVFSASDQLGNVRLSALRGRSLLRIGDDLVRPAPARGPASHVSYTGAGVDNFWLHAQMGNISMQVLSRRAGL